jgi:hypothetical protein
MTKLGDWIGECLWSTRLGDQVGIVTKLCDQIGTNLGIMLPIWSRLVPSEGKLVRNDQNCTWFISKTMFSFDQLCRSWVVDEIAFAQIQPQIQRKSLKPDEKVFGCTCFVVLNSSLISPISQCYKPVVTGVTWGWTMSVVHML